MQAVAPPPARLLHAADPSRAFLLPGAPDPAPAEESDGHGLRAELAAERARHRRAWRDLPGLRAAVLRAVELSSIRRVARDVGTSHEGLRRFLNGGKPYPVTLQKIVRWAERTEAAGATAPAEPAAAFARVLQGLSPAGRARVRDAMRRSLSESGAPVPSWLGEEAG